jgi:hypothetical protein
VKRSSLLRLPALVAIAAVTAGAAASPGAAEPVEAGYRSFSFGKTPSAPTAKDPQSKLWFHDGSWWGTLWNTNAKRHEIHRLDRATQRWTATGVAVDERATARADMLSHGARLYAVTAGTSESTAGHAPRVHRFAYDAQTRAYSRDLGPVQVGSGGTSSASIAKDSSGTVWITYAQGRAVRVSHSTTSEGTWAAPFVLPGATNLLGEDEPAMVAFRGKVGIMWSNQNTWTYHFATHQDGATPADWQSRVVHQAFREADNHINLKALEDDPAGQVFAVVKTELTSPGQPLHYVLVLKHDGSWAKHVFARTQDDHTRAQLAIDPENRRLYVFATAPCCSGGAIYYKEADLDAIAFEPGLGTRLISSSADPNINNVTTTKQPLSTASGLVAIAADDRTDFYLHADLETLQRPPAVQIDSGPSGATPSRSATFSFSSSSADALFECALDSGSFTACSSPKTYDGLQDGAHTFAVRAVGDGGTSAPAERSWIVDTVAPAAPEIAQPTSGTVGSSSVLVAGSAEPGTLVRVRDGGTTLTQATVDGAGSWRVTVSGLADGPHSLSATATDAAENTSPPSAAVDLLVDTVAPETDIAAVATSGADDETITFTLSSDDAGATFECSLDAAPFAPCDSPVTYGPLAAGRHSFEARAGDGAGNVDASPARHEWTVGSALFEDGFESGSLSAWTSVLTGADGSAGVTGEANSGSFAARLSATATTGSFAYARKTLSESTSDATFYGDFLVAAEGASGGNVPLLRIYDSAGTRIVSLYRQNQDGNKIRIGHSGIGATTAARLPLGVWGFFELHLAAGPDGGTIAVRMNGTTVYEASGANLGTGSFAALQIGNDTRAQAFTVLADDVGVR